jgi:hypothetical protein
VEGGNQSSEGGIEVVTERRLRFVALDELRQRERPDPFSRVEPADELAVGKRVHLRNRYAAGCQVGREFDLPAHFVHRPAAAAVELEYHPALRRTDLVDVVDE